MLHGQNARATPKNTANPSARFCRRLVLSRREREHYPMAEKKEQAKYEHQYVWYEVKKVYALSSKPTSTLRGNNDQKKRGYCSNHKRKMDKIETEREFRTLTDDAERNKQPG